MVLLEMSTESSLSAAGVPDRAGRLVVEAFAPNYVSVAVVVDGEAEVVPEGKAESRAVDVAVAAHVAGNTNLVSPGCAAVA